ncbi:MAG: tetratricopeptide repeat protein [Gammaproteobacteria bacterium]|nr:tetratricopeptide repeat protein [Gammaproteobacteria bacterium]
MNKKLLTIADIQQLHLAGRLEDAESGYLILLDEYPCDVTIMHGLAMLYAEMGELDNAQKYLEDALKLSPDHVTLCLHLANILKAKGLFNDAVKILKNVIRLDPHFSAAFNNLGTVYFAQEAWSDAINSYHAAIEIQPDYLDAYYNLGLALTKSKRYEEAMNAYKALIELSPQHAMGRFQLACLFMQQDQYQAAIEQFDIIERAHPFHFETQTNLATCYLKLGWLDHAKTHYLKALDLMSNDFQVLFNLGVISMQQGQTKAAIEFYSRALSVDPNLFEVHNNLAVAYLSIKQPDYALMHFRGALRLQPTDRSIQHIINILTHDQDLALSPPEYIRSLFDSYADYYDAHMTQYLNYQVPVLMYQLANEKANLMAKKWDILDLGCGTGLCGERFKPDARFLVGVDICEKMLMVAAKIYDDLIHADILSFLNTQTQTYDIILAGDVLVYYGDLSTVFSAVSNILRLNGIFVFNVEVGGPRNYEMTKSGRFAHSKNYLESLIVDNKFDILSYQSISIRTQDKRIVPGYLYLLNKTFLS